MANPFKIILAVSGIFVAGAVTGGFVSLRVVDHITRQKRITERTGPTEIGVRLAEQLQLTPEQKNKVRPIITRTSEDLRKLRRDSFSQTAALITKMDVELSQELTPEQRVLLTAVRAKEEERRKKWMAERTKRNDARPTDGPSSEGPRPPPPKREP